MLFRIIAVLLTFLDFSLQTETGSSNTTTFDAGIEITSGTLVYGTPSYLYADFINSHSNTSWDAYETDIKINYDEIYRFAKITYQERNAIKRDIIPEDGDFEQYHSSIIEYFEQINGIKNKTASDLVKHEDCSNNYWINFTDWIADIYQTIDIVQKSHVKEYTWSLASWIASDAAGWSSFAATVAADVKATSTKTKCDGTTRWINIQKDGKEETYLVAYAPYTTGSNCDTTAAVDAIQEALYLGTGGMEQKDAVSWCQSMTHGGIWHINVRVMRWENQVWCSQNIWDIPCQDL